MNHALDEDWELLLDLFPLGWEEIAVLSGALERFRGFSSASNLLQVLLLHVGRGYSLRETAVRARLAGLADVSDVALLKRLRKAGEWWRQLCVALLRESGFALRTEMRGWNVRALDGSLIKEPGPGGRQWRIHYSLRLPELECDHLELTPVQGRGRYPRFFGQILNSLVMRRARLLGDKAKIAEGSVLDIGCGQGLFLKQFADRGWRAIGIEVSSSAAFHAREILGGRAGGRTGHEGAGKRQFRLCWPVACCGTRRPAQNIAAGGTSSPEK